MNDLIRDLKKELPVIFAGKSIDELTGNAVKWNTLRNLKYSPDCPAGLFLKHGKKTVVARDVFLAWLEQNLSL